MTDGTTPAWHRALQAGAAACALGAVFFAGVMVADARTDPPGAVAAPPAPTVTETAPAPEPAPVEPPVPDDVAPVAPVAPLENALQVSIPDLGIEQGMVGLDILPDGRLEAPEIFDDVGWWSGGPVPGDPGAAIVVGHVDSTEGPAVFYDLSTLEVGDVVSFTRPDGAAVRFSVTDKQRFAKDDFPDDLVYRLDGKPSVHLVTCGGEFDRATGHYRDNIVVFADLIEEDPVQSTTASGPDEAGTGQDGTW